MSASERSTIMAPGALDEAQRAMNVWAHPEPRVKLKPMEGLGGWGEISEELGVTRQGAAWLADRAMAKLARKRLARDLLDGL